MSGSMSNLFFLAEADMTKFIGGVVVVVIWIIGAIASSMNKKAQQAKQRQQSVQPGPPAQRQAAPPPLPNAPVAAQQTYDGELARRRDAAQRHRDQLRPQMNQPSMPRMQPGMKP